MESLARLEHEGWQRVAGKCDSVWASSTRQFILPLLDAAEVVGGMSVLDVCCGPGYVLAAAAACGANPRGLDFSKEMMIDDAIREHADLGMDLPAGPPHHLFSGGEEFRRALARAGLDGESMIFELHSIYWNVPTTRHPFDAERDAGVRTAGLLARQTPARLQAIQSAIAESVRRYSKGDGFAIPKAGYAIAVGKKERMEKEEERQQRAAA